MKPVKFGTKEWAEHKENCITGCSHNCRYCYARTMAVGRFHRMRPDEWKGEKARPARTTFPKRKGLIMFPTAHDITPGTLRACLEHLDLMLAAGNAVLIVSKPHLECVEAMCRELRPYREQILFRFTIGSTDSDILKFWEPGAPDFNERLACLRYAYGQGYQTSVSCEPMLDRNVEAVLQAVQPYVTETIWIGKPNELKTRLKMNGETDYLPAGNELSHLFTDEWILSLYDRLNGNAQVRWKESIQKVLIKHGRISTAGEVPEGQSRPRLPYSNQVR